MSAPLRPYASQRGGPGRPRIVWINSTPAAAPGPYTAALAGPSTTSIDSTSSGFRSSSRSGPEATAPFETGSKSSSVWSIRMPSTNTTGARSPTSVCTPRTRMRDPISVNPEPGTTSMPGTRSVRRSERSRTPRSRTRRAASMTGCSTVRSPARGASDDLEICLGAPAVPLSAALWARRDRPRSVRISATAARLEALMTARECRKVHAARVPRWDRTRALRQRNSSDRAAATGSSSALPA